MKKEMYKIDIIKLTIIVVIATTVAILGLQAFWGYLRQQGLLSSERIIGKIEKRLTKGIIKENKELTPEQTILHAINDNRNRVVKIYAKLENKTDPNERQEKFLARGVIISQDGKIATAKGGFKKGKEYSIIIPGEKDIFNLHPIAINQQMAFFKIPLDFNLIVSLSKTKPKKDDLVVAIAGREKDGMAVGKVTEVKKIFDKTFILTTIPPKIVEAGTPLINSQKKTIGLYSTADKEGRSLFISSKDIRSAQSQINWPTN